MPEARFDPLGRRTVLLAPERAARGAPPVEVQPADPEPCDFCAGREDRTPPEIMRIGDPWRVRVFPNLYPAVDVHEVIAHTPEHHRRFEDLPSGHIAEILETYRLRVEAAGTRSVVAAFNRGRASGASRSHEHGQIFGLGLVPPTLARETSALSEQPCVACAIASDAPRLWTHGDVAVVAHPVPLVAHELLLVGRHAPSIEPSDDLAAAVARCLRALRSMLGDGVATNLVFHTAPRDVLDFHWHAHLMPRTAVWGSLELGAELPVVAADPGMTARELSVR